MSKKYRAPFIKPFPKNVFQELYMKKTCLNIGHKKNCAASNTCQTTKENSHPSNIALYRFASH
jgi:hypothetical protein